MKQGRSKTNQGNIKFITIDKHKDKQNKCFKASTIDAYFKETRDKYDTEIMYHLEKIFYSSHLFEKFYLKNLRPSFMNKEFRNEIMIRTYLLNKYRKDTNAANLFRFKRR